MAYGWQFYEHVIIENHEQGVLGIPVAGPDPTPCEIVRQHAPFGQRTVRWVAAAVADSAADLPELPAAKQFTADAVLKSREVGSHSPIPYTSGFLFILWGVYVYILRQARPVDGDFSFGGLPPTIANLGPAAVLFPAAKFQRFLDTGSFVASQAPALGPNIIR